MTFDRDVWLTMTLCRSKSQIKVHGHRRKYIVKIVECDLDKGLSLVYFEWVMAVRYHFANDDIG